MIKYRVIQEMEIEAVSPTEAALIAYGKTFEHHRMGFDLFNQDCAKYDVFDSDGHFKATVNAATREAVS